MIRSMPIERPLWYGLTNQLQPIVRRLLIVGLWGLSFSGIFLLVTGVVSIYIYIYIVRL